MRYPTLGVIKTVQHAVHFRIYIPLLTWQRAQKRLFKPGHNFVLQSANDYCRENTLRSHLMVHSLCTVLAAGPGYDRIVSDRLVIALAV